MPEMEFDIEEAQAEILEWEQREADRITRELQEGLKERHFSDMEIRNTINEVRSKIETQTTAQIPFDLFTVRRTLNQGWEIDWHNEHRKAA